MKPADVAAAQLRANPDWSDRRIAVAVGAHHSTVGYVRAALVAGGEIPASDIRLGADGRVTNTANTGTNPPPAPAIGGVNLAAQRFGRLLVLEVSGRARRAIWWRCRCDCGREITTRTGNLTNGHTRSCGCYGREARGQATVTHGSSRTREHMAWVNMRQRCTNRNRREWKDYGGRGITVCERWHDFANFLADMGERPEGTTLDRIDNDGNYEPGNCRWATLIEQARNMRSNRLLSLGGRTRTMREWSEQLGVKYTTLHSRLRHASLEQIAARMGMTP